MAKIQCKYSFSNAVITKENGKYVITEYDKEDTRSYDLSDVLDDLLDKDGVSLVAGIDSKPDPVS